MTTLIGLTGWRGAGKDTAFGYVQEWASGRGLSAQRRGFADALKLSFARLFIPSISLEEAVMWCNELKMAPGSDTQSFLTMKWGGRGPDGTTTFVEHQIDGRQALQRYGTEGHREVFGEDFWVDSLLPLRTLIDENDLPIGPAWPWNFRGPLASELPDIAVVTDTRFESEAKRIILLGGTILEVVRPSLQLEDDHISEKGLPEDFITGSLVNHDGPQGLFDLREQVFDYLEAMWHNS